MTDATATTEPNTGESPTPVTETARGGRHHLLVGGAALAAMAFVVGLWLIRGGSPGMLLGEQATLAGSMPGATPAQQLAPALQPRINAPQLAQRPRPVPNPMARPNGTHSTPSGVPGQPAAVAPSGMPVFVSPHGVVNPLTMLHAPAYYQHWAQVGATFVNPLAYQQIMNLMLRHAMQAWGMGPPVTVAIDDHRAPRG